MSDDKNTVKSNAEGGRSPQSLAQRRRERLREFVEARKAKEEALRREQEELARALKEAEKRERRRLTNERLTNEKRLKYALGSLVLAKLRTFPGSDWQFLKSDLNMLADNDRSRLAQALRGTPPAPRQTDSYGASGEPSANLQT